MQQATVLLGQQEVELLHGKLHSKRAGPPLLQEQQAANSTASPADR